MGCKEREEEQRQNSHPQSLDLFMLKSGERWLTRCSSFCPTCVQKLHGREKMQKIRKGGWGESCGKCERWEQRREHDVRSAGDRVFKKIIKIDETSENMEHISSSLQHLVWSKSVCNDSQITSSSLSCSAEASVQPGKASPLVKYIVWLEMSADTLSWPLVRAADMCWAWWKHIRGRRAGGRFGGDVKVSCLQCRTRPDGGAWVTF